MNSVERHEKLDIDELWATYHEMPISKYHRTFGFALATQLTYLRWHELNHPVGSTEFWQEVRMLFEQFERNQLAALGVK